MNELQQHGLAYYLANSAKDFAMSSGDGFWAAKFAELTQ